METSLTIENLLLIFQAMDRIKPIDRSDYFNNYYQEIVSRLQDESKMKGYIESQLFKAQQDSTEIETDNAHVIEVMNALFSFKEQTGNRRG